MERVKLIHENTDLLNSDDTLEISINMSSSPTVFAQLESLILHMNRFLLRLGFDQKEIIKSFFEHYGIAKLMLSVTEQGLDQETMTVDDILNLWEQNELSEKDLDEYE